jgi:hypothetical protein
MCALFIFVKWSFLHEVAQGRGHREHPLAHRQAGKNMIAEVCSRLHHALRVARGEDTWGCEGDGHEVVMSAVVAPGPGKTVGKDARGLQRKKFMQVPNSTYVFAQLIADLDIRAVKKSGLPLAAHCVLLAARL